MSYIKQTDNNKVYKHFTSMKARLNNQYKKEEELKKFRVLTSGRRKIIPSIGIDVIYEEFNNMSAFVINEEQKNYLNVVELTQGEIKKYKKRIIEKISNFNKKYLVIDFSDASGGQYVINFDIKNI